MSKSHEIWCDTHQGKVCDCFADLIPDPSPAALQNHPQPLCTGDPEVFMIPANSIRAWLSALRNSPDAGPGVLCHIASIDLVLNQRQQQSKDEANRRVLQRRALELCIEKLSYLGTDDDNRMASDVAEVIAMAKQAIE